MKPELSGPSPLPPTLTVLGPLPRVASEVHLGATSHPLREPPPQRVLTTAGWGGYEEDVDILGD